ncbi:MAG: hypothetical protein EBR82_60915 [Caulobacteraceae bacterium]|nr:hypothetical protein [Caulobacteraceae bacterium]
MTKASFIKNNNGKLFKATVTGVPTIEDIPEIRQRLERLAKLNNTTLEEDDNAFRIRDYNYVVSKPKITKSYTGTINFRSKDYIVNRDIGESYGIIPASDHFTDNSFYIDAGNGKITYQLV